MTDRATRPTTPISETIIAGSKMAKMTLMRRGMILLK